MAEKFFIQSGTGKKLSQAQVQSGSFDTGTFFIESGSGKSFSQGELAAPATQPTPTPTPSPLTNIVPGDETFFNQLQTSLLERAGLTSSADTPIETFLQKAEAGITTAQEKTSAVIESKFNREIDFQREQFEQTRTTKLESRRGFATAKVGLEQLDDRTQKSLRDLEQRKQELLLTGEALAASNIADLQFKALEFQQQAEQQTFSNLLGLGRFALDIQSEERLQDSINSGDTRILGNPSDGIFAVHTDAQGNSTLEQLLEGEPESTEEDKFLTLSQVQTLTDRGAVFVDPVSGEERPYEVTDKISDVRANVGTKATSATLSETRAIAADTASKFTNRAFGNWDVPTGDPAIVEAVESIFGTGKTRLSTKEFELFLQAQFGLDSKTTEGIVSLAEVAKP